MHIESFYDPVTCTFSYVVVDFQHACCAVIDSVLNYEQGAAKVTTESADQVIAYIRRKNLTNQWILETHIHADHITAAHYLKKQIGGQTAIGVGIKDVLPTWIPLFDMDNETPVDGSQFDQVFTEGDQFNVGQLTAQVMLTPGHTPACSTYCFNQVAFIGDTLFHPDSGTARADFPGGSAEQLYDSINKIFQLPEDTQLYLCHDYPEERDVTCCVTVADQKQYNVMLNATTSVAEFVSMRNARDQKLAVPRLLLPSIQSNMRLGDFGTTAKNGIQYIRIPINQI